MKASLEINENSILLKTEVGGSQTAKYISPEDLVSAMSKRRMVDSGRLPCNTHRYIQFGSTRKLYLWYPAHCKKFCVSSGIGAQDYPIPSVLIKFVFENDKLTNTFLWATDSTFLRAYNPPLYYFPYGNVYSDSHLCWGSVKYKSDYFPSSVDYNASLIFVSSYNNDLGRNIGRFGYGNRDEESLNLLKNLKNVDSFPMDQLIRHVYLSEA